MKQVILFLFLLWGSLSSLSQPPAFKAIVYDSSATSGYYCFSNGVATMILDKFGEVVYYLPNKEQGVIFDMHSNGLSSISDPRSIYFMDSTFRKVDSLKCKGYSLDNHDRSLLNNGHYLLLGTKTIQLDLSEYFYKGRRGCATARVKCSAIQEQDVNKNVVFDWLDTDHFLFDDIDTFSLDTAVCEGIVDWSHCNAVDLDEDGNILASMRNLNEITKISRVDGSIIWRLGGKRNQFKFIDSTADSTIPFVPFQWQHEVRAIGNGHIILFDNGYGSALHAARALEFKIDEKNKIATLVWSYTFDSTMLSVQRGSVQRLANSNTLITFGMVADLQGKRLDTSSVCFVLVDTNGKKIFQLNGIKGVFKAHNYPSLPWQVIRPVITAFDSAGVKYLDAGIGHSSYKWNNGSTSSIIEASISGEYFVYLPYGEGGFVRSEKYIAGNTTEPRKLPKGTQKPDR